MVMKLEAMEPQCCACRYWEPIMLKGTDAKLDGKVAGWCRRNAPVAGSRMDRWPTVRHDESCGEFAFMQVTDYPLLEFDEEQ